MHFRMQEACRQALLAYDGDTEFLWAVGPRHTKNSITCYSLPEPYIETAKEVDSINMSSRIQLDVLRGVLVAQFGPQKEHA